jgi:hypothetical protein
MHGRPRAVVCSPHVGERLMLTVSAQLHALSRLTKHERTPLHLK